MFANVGYGLFGSKHFAYSNYKVAECITAEGRRIHKQMEIMAQQDPFNFEIVFGFTDSIFVRVDSKTSNKEELIREFIDKCKKELGMTVEIKNVFVNSIVYGEKNRFVGWSGKENEEIIIKGLDGLAKSNPLWVRRWFYKILNEIIKRPEKRFETIPKLLKQAIFELQNVICKSKERIDEELRFTQKLRFNPEQYKQGVRAGLLGRLLDKDKGEEVYWFETVSKDKDTNGNFSTTIPTEDNLDLQKYKETLLNKLKGTLLIAGFDVKGIS